MIKQELRNIYKQKRLNLPGKERLQQHDLMLILFQQLSFPDVELLLSYWPMEHTGEINTFLFTDFLAFRIPGLQLAFPRADLLTGNMEAVLVNEDTSYQKNEYGIAEPVGGTVIPPEALDMVFVPLLVFDKQGHRVGYGKGFYDRFLTKCRKNAARIGFSDFDPVESIDDANEFDVPLTIGITPNSIYEF